MWHINEFLFVERTTMVWLCHKYTDYSQSWYECQPQGIKISFIQGVFGFQNWFGNTMFVFMDVAASFYEGTQLRQINLCKLAIQATFLSDLASVDGKASFLRTIMVKIIKKQGGELVSTGLRWAISCNLGGHSGRNF